MTLPGKPLLNVLAGRPPVATAIRSAGRVLAALFDPDPAQDAHAQASGTPGSTLTGPLPGTLPSPAAEMAEFADQVVNRLFSAGLSLESAHSTGDGPACDRVAAAVGELDETIQDIRTAVSGQPRSSSRDDPPART